MLKTTVVGFGLALFIGGCSTQAPFVVPAEDADAPTGAITEAVTEAVTEDASADDKSPTGVIAVEIADASVIPYNFSVTVQSPDTGCDQYANWWEVLTPDGELLYRRILAHSHVDEQPFTRSGGPVAVGSEDEVIVRSHMHPDGYSPQAMRGTIGTGFIPTTLPTEFAVDLAEVEPQPSGCAF